MNPNKVPDEIKEELKVFSNLLREYVYYDHQHIDRTEKMESLIRSVALINDTDSCILSLDGWYRFILDKVLNSGLEYPIMEMELNMDTDEISKVYTKDYDFEHDEIIEIDRAVTPNKIVPQDNLKYSIINIICYVITEITKNDSGKVTNVYVNDGTTEFQLYGGLSDSSVVYRVVVETEPMKHFIVERFMKKEIKKEFDKKHIKIPYQQIEVHNGK